MTRSLTTSWVMGVALMAPSAQAATRYVDATLSGDCPSTYAPATRSCSGGTDVGHASLASAAAAATAGDTVILREGTYPQLVPGGSGVEGQPITFKSYDGETARIAQLSQLAISITNKSYITIEGLAIDEVLGWGRLEDADHIIIISNVFTKATATGTTGSLKLVRSDHNQLLGNVFDDGNDNVVVQESDNNLIEGNTFRLGRHALLSIRCANFNVIRGNSFDNPDQKAGEIYDCEGVSDAPYALDATKRNLFELNRFANTRPSDVKHRYNGIQFAGQQGIVRRNLFYDNLGGGIGIQVYSDEALINYGHRIYNNTFVENRCFGFWSADGGSPSQYFNTVVKGNLFFGNADCSGAGAQHLIGNPTAVSFADNELADVDPGFVDLAARDLALRDDSAMVDVAPFATRTASNGNGTELPVNDAGYFFDGYGIAGQIGDLIQLRAQTTTARVVAIDYQTNVLSLDQALSWDADVGVHLAYADAAPDMGALELGMEDIGVGGNAGTGGGGSGGDDSGAGSGGDGSGASNAGDPNGEAANPTGCACRTASHPQQRGGWPTLLGLMALGIRRRDPNPAARC